MGNYNAQQQGNFSKIFLLLKKSQIFIKNLHFSVKLFIAANYYKIKLAEFAQLNSAC